MLHSMKKPNCFVHELSQMGTEAVSFANRIFDSSLAMVGLDSVASNNLLGEVGVFQECKSTITFKLTIYKSSRTSKWTSGLSCLLAVETTDFGFVSCMCSGSQASFPSRVMHIHCKCSYFFI